MMKQRYRSKNQSFFAEMNFTPFIDIIFVMMIIFMIAAPFSENKIEVQLPHESAKDIDSDLKESPVISLTKDNRLFLNNKRITIDDLGKKLRIFFKINPAVEVFLKSDKEVPYGEVIKVMARVKKSGITKLGMVTEDPGNTASQK